MKHPRKSRTESEILVALDKLRARCSAIEDRIGSLMSERVAVEEKIADELYALEVLRRERGERGISAVATGILRGKR